MRASNGFWKRLAAGATVVASVWTAAAQSVVIGNISPSSGTAITNGATVTVGADVTPSGGAVVEAVYLAYSWAGSPFTTNAMSLVSGVRYEAVIPRLAAGALTNRVFCSWTNGVAGVTNESASADFNYTVSDTLLSPFRFTDFANGTWTPYDANVTNYTYQLGGVSSQWWVAQMAKYPLGGTTALRPPGSAIPTMGIRPVEGAFIRTPLLSDGVGSIYYTSIISEAGYGAHMEVQYTTNSTPDNWQTATMVTYDAVRNYRATNSIPIVINNRDVRYVRFLRTDNGISYDGRFVGLDAGLIYMDNIYVSQPPTSVTITEEQYNPGYPAQDQDVRVRCRVTDVDDGYPSVNRQVRVFYSWESESGPWTQTNMTLIADDVYEGVIPQHGAGMMYYYFRCDFDGYFFGRDPDYSPPPASNGPQPFYSEDQSPVYLIEKGEDNYRNYEIRRFQSDVQVMRVLADPDEATVDMELVGDHEWQGLTLVAGITNLNWAFVGIAGYTNDAASYDSTPWMWGDNDQDFPYPPVAGYAERDATTNVVAELEYEGFLLIRLNRLANTNSYIVKRAVYQNFDVWTASQTEFERSLGLYTIQTFKQEFSTDSWYYDAYDASKYKNEPVDATTPTDFVRGAPALTSAWWAYDQSRVVAERNVYDAGLTAFVNRRGVELDGGIARGRVWNTYASRTEGIENLAFNARLSLNDRYFTYFKGPTKDGASPFVVSADWPRNYHVMALLRAKTLSPGLGSLSVLTWISPGYMNDSGEPSYYEVRLSQGDPDTSANNKRMNLQLFRWKDGVATQIGDTQQQPAVGQPGVGNEYDLTSVKAIRVEMPSTGGIITVRVGRTGVEGTYQWSPITFTDPVPLTTFGTFGFHSYDAEMEVSKVKVFKGTETVSVLPAENWNPVGGMTSANWYMGGKRMSTDQEDRWQVPAGENSLVRDLPSQTLGIYLAPMPDGLSMQPNFAELTQVATRNVSTLAYQPFSVQIKRWNESFVLIKNEATGEINAVADEFALSPWRAVTRSDKTPAGTEESISGVFYYDWTTQTEQNNWVRAPGNTGWLVLEGWINTSPGSKGGEVQFDRSRANTNLVQALITPYLTNNIGSIAFDWRSGGAGQVVFAVERTAAGAESTWIPVLTITNVASSGSEFVAIRTDFPGRIRVRVDGSTVTTGILKIDNLIARDNPPEDDTSWTAYNALITAAQTARAFEPTNPDAQTAYLNNDPTNGVPVNEVLDEHLAFIQTPKVGTGIGEIAFWYRIWDTAGGSGTISLQVAPSADTPDEQWKVLTNIVVESTQTDYIYFSNTKIYEPDNKVLRIYCLDTGNRVCIDNVLMTEPVRAGYEFRSIILLPEQPVVGQTPGIEVEIGRFIMNPEQIQVYVSYLVGTNQWGYTNWWTSTYGQTYELSNSAPRVYRTAEGVTLPAGAIDDVVQFVVWGVHKDINVLQGDKPIFQGTNAFVNPSWYYPVDLNEEPVLKAQGWSPYYFVYSCPPGSVWVNEIRYRSLSSEVNNEFIEIIGPAGASLGNWRLQMVNTANAVRKESVVDPGFMMRNIYNGWGFLVWGDAAVSNGVDHILIPDWAIGQIDIFNAGGIRVIRSNGAWEDRVAWGVNAISTLVDQQGYTYAGAKLNTNSLSLVTSGEADPGSSADDFVWSLDVASPGMANGNQALEELTPTTIFFMVYSAIGPNGAHSVGVNPLEMIAVPQGGSTNITYTADDWYRIDAFLSDGEVVGSALGERSYEWTVTDVQGDVSNHVMFVEAYPGVSTSWLDYWGTDTGQTLDDSVPSMDYAYMLDINPWAAHEIAYVITGMTVSNGGATITVKLTDHGVGHGPINGQVAVYARESLATGTWGVPIAYADIGEIDSNGEAVVTIDTLPADAQFFKSEIVEGD